MKHSAPPFWLIACYHSFWISSIVRHSTALFLEHPPNSVQGNKMVTGICDAWYSNDWACLLVLQCARSTPENRVVSVSLFWEEDWTDVPARVLIGRFPVSFHSCNPCVLSVYFLTLSSPLSLSLGLERVLFRVDWCLHRYRLLSVFSNSHRRFLSDPFRYHQL